MSNNPDQEKLLKKKQEEEAMWTEYIEQMKQTRAREEAELRKLKERQAKRKEQRAEQEKMMFEMKKKQDEQKQAEIEEKKQREAEAKRKRLEEAERKRQAMAQAMQKQKENVKPNYIINKKQSAQSQDKTAPVVPVIKTKEQLAEEKKIALGLRIKPLKIDNLEEDELKKKAEELWEQIVHLESEKYDLEERRKRQDYDLKELNERQRQISRNKALKKGLDPEAFTGKYPPKINVASKYERRTDRYTFADKKALFEGGWEELYKKQLEKSWEERIKEYKDRGSPKLMTWDPNNPKNKETYEPGTRIYDEEVEDVDLMPGPVEQEEEEEEEESEEE